MKFPGDISDFAIPGAKSKHKGQAIGLDSLKGDQIFASPCFTLTVGPKTREFFVQQSILAQSPVLKGMCQASFVEAATNTIFLPDDPPGLIDILVRFLYTGRLPSLANLERGIDTLADLYVIAEKFQLGYMQEQVLIEYKPISTLYKSDTSANFIQVSRRVYERIPESRHQFRDHFIRQLPDVIGKLTDEERAVLGTSIYKGGAFAEDVYKALCGSHTKNAPRSASNTLIKTDTI